MSPQPRRLPNIPYEILKQIGDELDRHSAVQLSLTCKALRDAGESRIWSAINICTGRKSPGRQFNDDLEMEPDDAQGILRDRIESILKALQSYPFRAECVHTLILEPCAPSTAQLHDIFRRVHTNLQTLAVFSPYFQLGDEDIFALPEWEIETWPRLRNLRFMLTSYLNMPTVGFLSMRMPKLSHMELCCRYGIAPSPLPPTHFAHLTHLSLVEFDDFDKIIPSILNNAPDLVDLSMSDVCDPDAVTKPLKEAVRSHKNLKTFNFLCEPEYSRNTILDKGLSELVTYSDKSITADYEAFEMDLTELEQIPRHPGVKHYIDMRGDRIASAEYASLGMDIISPKHRQANRVPRTFVRSLLNAPSLVDIEFAEEKEGLIQPDFFRLPTTGPLFDTVDSIDWTPPAALSENWEREGLRGVVIRTYLDETNGDELIHARMISRAREKEGRYHVGARRQWHEFTRFRGRLVPYPVILQIYSDEKQDPEWQVGGRKLALKRSAWDILVEWYENSRQDPNDDPPDQTFSDSEDESYDSGEDRDSDEDDEWEDYDDGMDYHEGMYDDEYDEEDME